MPRGTFLEFAEHFEGVAAGLHAAPKANARVIAPVLATSVHEQFGKSPPLATLAESTQDERSRLGYAPNDPLVRTGELLESYIPQVADGAEGVIAAVGSAHPLAKSHEDGFFNHRSGQMVPPRPAAWIGFHAALPTAKTMWKNTIGRIIKTGA